MSMHLVSSVSITCLPDEILSIILRESECCDILNFSMTCKRFYDLVTSNQILWKLKFKQSLPPDIFIIMNAIDDCDWLEEMKRFYKNKTEIYSVILTMSPKYYWRNCEVTLEDLKDVYNIGLSNQFSYHYLIIILQDLIKKGNRFIGDFEGVKPYTLTEMFYAKIILRHLMHTFLAIKWVRAHIRNELLPEIVVNYFLQWIDTESMHADEDVNEKINELAHKVELLLETTYPSKNIKMNASEKLRHGKITEKEILNAVSSVIYHQRHIAVTSTANLDTLDIIKVFSNKCGNVIVIAAVFQAVARSCGVHCEIIAFPNHLFLEWRDVNAYPYPQTYTIDLETGHMDKKRRCPFSQNSHNSNYHYCPDSLLQYLYSTYHTSMGAIKNWNTRNALLLLNFLGTNHDNYNPYRNFLSCLLNTRHLSALSLPLNLKQLHPSQIDIIWSLSTSNGPSEAACGQVIVKKHEGNIKYAVGMICYHKKYEYVCVIRGWDYSCAVECENLTLLNSLQFGPNQAFYYVFAADQSPRYVAQENLTEITRPTRLFHLEDMLAREFTHFDGFSYVPNEQKKTEYPTEGPIRDVFVNKFLQT